VSGRQFSLHDGRRLGYSEFGAPRGRPILYCHGFPASRLEARLAHEAALRTRVRLIAADRPGYGLSDFQPNRRIADWPRDLRELADALGLDRFAVLGISGGAPYVIACAGAIPERLTAAGIVCGLGRTDRGEFTADMNLIARASFAVARRAPPLSRLVNRALASVLRGNPRLTLKLMASRLPPPDQEVLSQTVVFGMISDSYREALRQGGRGAALDLTLYAQPWETVVESIRVPCHLWHGEADTTVPVAMGRRLAAALPDCRAEFYPDEGHYSLPVRRIGEILAVLAARE
jgi:pimeloyl-ACP methyl ester carboxylesterase